MSNTKKKAIKWSWSSAVIGAATATAVTAILNAKPKDPTFHLISINLTSFKLNLPLLDADLLLTVHVTNPNITPIHYSSTTMSIFYDGSLLGSAPVLADSQPSRSCKLLRLQARLDGLQLAHHAAKFVADVAKREMLLDAKIDIEGAAKVLWWDHKFKRGPYHYKYRKSLFMYAFSSGQLLNSEINHPVTHKVLKSGDQSDSDRVMENGNSREVTVAALQFACTDDVSTNIATAERLVRDAHAKGANIILIQELFEGYYFCQAQREDFFQRAKPYKGHPTVLRMQKLAKELGVVLPVSFFEEANNAHYNSIAIIDADGTDLGLYRKAHIPDGPGYQEKFYFNPGDTGFKVFQTKFAKIGVAICWDQWFPETARAMALQGAELLFYPTAIGSEPQDTGLDSRHHWTRVMQGHAGANLVPLVASNRIGKETIQTEHGDSNITFYGNSFIAGQTGEIVAAADDKGEAVLIAKFDLDKIKAKRHSWGVFRDRRPDLYKVLLTLDGSTPSQ